MAFDPEAFDALVEDIKEKVKAPRDIYFEGIVGLYPSRGFSPKSWVK